MSNVQIANAVEMESSFFNWYLKYYFGFCGSSLVACCCDVDRRLKLLNVTMNHLTHLPSVNNNVDLNRIEQLFASFNEFTNDVIEVVSQCPRLRTVHLAHNSLTEIYDRFTTSTRCLRLVHIGHRTIIVERYDVYSRNHNTFISMNRHSLAIEPDCKQASWATYVLDITQW